jgi:hypothetical protein
MVHKIWKTLRKNWKLITENQCTVHCTEQIQGWSNTCGLYYGRATRSRQKWIGYTLSRKHESTYLHNREKKLDINDYTFSVSLPLSTSASMLSLSVTRTCTNTQHVEDLKWVCICETGIMFSTSIVRLRIVTVPSHIWDLKSSPENYLNRPPVSPTATRSGVGYCKECVTQ